MANEARKAQLMAELRKRELLAELDKRTQESTVVDSPPQFPSGGSVSLASEGVSKSGVGGFLRAVGGVGETALQVGSSAIATPIAGLAGIGSALIPGGKTGAERVAQVSSALTFQPRSEEGQLISQSLGEAFEGLDSKVTDALDTGNPLVSTVLKTLLFGGPSALLLKRPVSAPSVARPSTVPTTAELFKSGSQAFSKARTLGEGIKRESFDRLANSVTNIKDNSGLSLRFNEVLHPKSSSARQEILNTIKKGEVTFDDLMELRQIAQEAAGALDKGDAFRGVMLKNSLDDYVNSLGPKDVKGGNPTAAAASLNEARDLWSRASKAATIEEAIDIAGINANTVTGAGFENALRIQFKALSRRIRKGQERGFTPDEIKLIQRVATGGPVDNAFRLLGKLAPTGVVSGAASFGGGFAAGGLAGMIAVPAAGLLGRHIATKATIRNAGKASELARSGGLLSPDNL